MTSIYRGFSFKNWQRNKSFILTDVELVKRDLLNHIFTGRGERVFMRHWGTDIQDLLFEPFDHNTIVLISDQIREVIDYDPRVVLDSDDDYSVIPYYDDSILIITANLRYVELDLSDILDIHLEFNV